MWVGMSDDARQVLGLWEPSHEQVALGFFSIDGC
jgi:hypothetical protein